MRIFFIFSSLVCFFLSKANCDVKILYTSALIPYKFEERKHEYIHSLNILEKYGYMDKTYVVESGPNTSFSFFGAYCDHVFYADTNDATLRNKGVNEAKACLAALSHYDFDEDDILIKLTGRYFFNNDRFIHLVESHPEVDVFVAPRQVHGCVPVQEVGVFNCGVTTGCLAMRCKYFKQMLEGLDLEKMERNLIDIESEVEWFVQKMILQGKNVVCLDKIGLTANVANGRIVQW